jgi:hypothetical protein
MEISHGNDYLGRVEEGANKFFRNKRTSSDIFEASKKVFKLVNDDMKVKTDDICHSDSDIEALEKGVQ